MSRTEGKTTSNTGVTVIVYGLAPSVNTIPPAMVVAPPGPGASPQTTLVMLQTSNVAMSVSLLGTVGGVQLSAVFQSFVAGFELHVALPPWSGWMMAIRANVARILFIPAFIFGLVRL